MILSLFQLESLESGGFELSECSSRLVLKMQCQDLRCGLRPAAVTAEHDSLTAEHDSLTAGHGDWPWQVTLLKEGTHVCDGTLIHDNWVLSTKSCFQG